jgi:hypothetical protein
LQRRRRAVSREFRLTKHLPFLDFEQSPRVQRKLPQFDPVSRIGMSAADLTLLVPPIHGVDARLKPVVLGAQPDEGCLL